FTFIPANVDDNPINLRKNPDYISTLHSLKGVERDRLLYGNWRVQESGKIFKLEWFQFYNIQPNFDLKILTIDTAQQIKSAND
ncbi:terminase family protein, partial [Listeria monocytogenes]|uniref:terminase large subunit domain-containing protein n=1 Tax=Listeria monocytogenes TaxID=1639 RepID=UPI002FDC68B8